MILNENQYQNTARRIQIFLEVKFEEHVNSPHWESLLFRLKENMPELLDRMLRLYGHSFDFYYHFERLIEIIAEGWFERSNELKSLDAIRSNNENWYQSGRLVGGCAYIDLFSGDLKTLREKIGYFNELGITYLHLMPPYKTPEGDDDGGYAVSSYRQLDPNLGDIEELREIASELRRQGISLALDFVFNHTADDHEWAKKALKGDQKYQDYYLFFQSKQEVDEYEQHLRSIFPEERPGNFTYISTLKKWVWTTFHSYQWDLNYRNPEVLRAMSREMLFLSNLGVEIMRMDAVPFLWKQKGTNCENLPEAHVVIEILNLISKIACPAMVFKSEAIVAPDEIKKYISPKKCQVSYNPMMMSQVWEALATRRVNLLYHGLYKRFEIDENCSWINYVRSHDDIGWGFDDHDAQEIGIEPFSHRQFLTNFFVGHHEASFANGTMFQEDPKTGDARVCGTTSSLCGLQQSFTEENDQAMSFAIRRILLLYGITFSLGGIPLIYLGDEIGLLSDESYQNDPEKIDDARWLHRPFFDWKRAEKRFDPNTAVFEIFQGIVKLSQLRNQSSALERGKTDFFWTNNEHVLGYFRSCEDQTLVCLANFNDYPETVDASLLRQHGVKKQNTDLLTGKTIIAHKSLNLQPLEFLILLPM